MKSSSGTPFKMLPQTAALQLWFSKNYTEARARFHQACDKQNIPYQSFEHPQLGPNGETLSTDVAFVGNRNADKLLILISGTHGAETLVGSGCQIGWLDNFQSQLLPENTAVLLIHAINPYGAAWRSRYTEDNVDLNRNFIHHDKTPPQNAHYGELHQALSCRAVNGPERILADQRIADFCKTQGEKTYSNALCQGQYTHPDGLGFGGQGATWSNRTLHEILQIYAQQANHVAVIDYHSGIGPYGYGSLFTRHKEGTQALNDCRAWYGKSLMEPATTNDAFYPIIGDLCQGIAMALPAAQVSSVLLEYGTYDFPKLLNAFRQQAPLYDCSQIDAEQEEQLRSSIQAFFYPATDDWLEMIWVRSEQVIRQSLEGLSGI
jgi:hypothetical protein